MSGVDSIGFQNPNAALYTQQSAGLNEDFMFNATQNQAGAQNPNFTGLYGLYNQANLANQTNQDTFERQGSSGLSTGLKIGAVGGIGAAAGAYYFGGDKFKINPFINGEYQDSFLRTLQDSKTVDNEAAKLIEAERAQVLTNNKITNIHQYNAIKEFAETGKKPAGVALPKGLDQAKAKTLVENVEKGFNGINTEALTEQARRTFTIEGGTAHLNELNNNIAQLRDLKGAPQEQLVKHIQDNAKLYGIKETEEAAIKAAAEKEAGKGVDALIKEAETAISNQKTNIANTRRSIITKNGLGTYFDTATNTVKEGAPKSLIKAVRNFKLTKAGKVGAAVAAAGVVLGFLFGGSKS